MVCAEMKRAPSQITLDFAFRGRAAHAGGTLFRVPRKVDPNALVPVETIERDGVTMLVDPVSLQYLAGSEVDFVDDLIGASFRIKNPNATASCGCGTSFSI